MADDPAHEPGRILIGKSDSYQYLTLALGNRHGLVAGATGTGKTVTLQVLAEGFSRAGTAVFAADIKGDLAGIAMPGDEKPHFVQRAKDIGIAYAADAFPVAFWDLFGQSGYPVRARISDMGPLLLARLLELNDVQEGVLNIAFEVADKQKLPLVNLKDLRALLQDIGDKASDVSKSYGNVAPATIGTIQRRLLVLENQGAAGFFGEPELDINDFLRCDRDGRGLVNILSAEKLMRSPRLYAIFLLWMLSELFEKMPEVGDLEKPKLVFFFDEAHLLFDNAPKALLNAIEQVVRLIRSKGVGVYFVTQNPSDVPETVLGQLGNRVQHALRAFTPRDQKAVRAAAETFRRNPSFDTATVITGLAVGEALVSMKCEVTILDHNASCDDTSCWNGFAGFTSQAGSRSGQQMTPAGRSDWQISSLENLVTIRAGRLTTPNMQAFGKADLHQECFSPFQRRLFERQLFAILDHRPLRVGWVGYGEDYTFIYVLLVAAFSSPGIIRKLETELIGFGPAGWVIYVKGNDNNTIDVAFFARRDGGLRNACKAHALCESRIRMHKAAIRGSCR
jgi:hypothetical protein